MGMNLTRFFRPTTGGRRRNFITRLQSASKHSSLVGVQKWINGRHTFQDGRAQQYQNGLFDVSVVLVNQTKHLFNMSDTACSFDKLQPPQRGICCSFRQVLDGEKAEKAS
jgi:hypothetical protein